MWVLVILPAAITSTVGPAEQKELLFSLWRRDFFFFISSGKGLLVQPPVGAGRLLWDR